MTMTTQPKRWIAYEVDGERGEAALAFALSDLPGEVEMNPHEYYRLCFIQEVESGEREELSALICGTDQGFYPAHTEWENLAALRTK